MYILQTKAHQKITDQQAFMENDQWYTMPSFRPRRTRHGAVAACAGRGYQIHGESAPYRLVYSLEEDLLDTWARYRNCVNVFAMEVAADARKEANEEG